MPQPLKSWPEGLEFTPEALDKRPRLAVLIAKISAEWAHLEMALGVTLAVMIQAESRTGVAMYLALTGSAAQEAALAAAANIHLSGSRKVEFAELTKRVRARARERNKVIHCLWGSCAKYPDALVNCPAEARVRDIFSGIIKNEANGIVVEASSELVSSMSLYHESDLRDLLQRLQEAGRAILLFAATVAVERGEWPQEFPAPHGTASMDGGSAPS